MTIKVGCSLVSVLVLLAASAQAQPTSGDPQASSNSAAENSSAAPMAATPAQPSMAPAAPTPTPPPPTPAPVASAQAAVAGSISPPPAGKGQVVFFRPSRYVGWAVWFNVRENGTALGKLSNGAYFVRVTDPGAHTYTAATENHNVLHLEIDDGETYYVRGSVQMGILMGEANMAPSDQATFEKSFKGMHLAKPVEPETKPDASTNTSTNTSK